MEVARTRKEKGMSLSALDVRGDPESGDTTKYFAKLRELVEDVKVWPCADLLERWTNNPLLDSCKDTGFGRPVSVYLRRRNKSCTDRPPRNHLVGYWYAIEE